MKTNIKKGDTVIIIAGNDRDLSNPRKVLEVQKTKRRVVVENANMVTKHTKPTAQQTKGGIIKQEASLHISNVMLWDAKAKKGSKVKRERDEKGKLKRVLKTSREEVSFSTT